MPGPRGGCRGLGLGVEVLSWLSGRALAVMALGVLRGLEASEAAGESGVGAGPHQQPGEPCTPEGCGGALACGDHTRELFGALGGAQRQV